MRKNLLRKIKPKFSFSLFRKKSNIEKILLFVCFIILINLLYPSPFVNKFNLRVGEIAPRDIIAPYTFYIKKNKSELEKEIMEASNRLNFILEKKSIYNDVEKEIFNFFVSIDTSKSKRDYIKKIIPNIGDKNIKFLLKNKENVKNEILILTKEILDRGLIESKAPIFSFYIEIKEGNSYSIRNKEDILELNQIKEILVNKYNDPIELETFITLINYFIKPNLVIDYKEMEKRKEAALRKISPTKGIVLKGEMIVRAHDVVTKEVVEKINSMGIESKELIIKKAIGRNILYLIGIFVLLFSIYLFKPAILNDLKKISIIVIMLTITMAIISLISMYNLPKYVIPIGGIVFLISLLIGGDTGFCSIFPIPIFAIAYGESIESIVLILFIGIFSVLISFKTKKVSEFYKTILFFIIGYILSTIGLELIKLSPFEYIIKLCGWSIIGGISSSFIAFVLLPLFEKLFRITTPITLVEYTDPNHPLIIDLATCASGTYNHSMNVAQLAEAAARAIRCDALLTKVGAYYHDIGKIKKPKYFIENRVLKSNDDIPKINPKLYADVVVSHVKDGVELAKENNLPNEVINIIKEHHGTTLIEYFFKEAKQSNKEPQEIDFRYPGPLPSTKESAIIMLADAVESATRSIENPIHPNKLMNLIENIIQKRLEDGQLSRANLTLNEIDKIEKSFLPVLIGIFHQRIKY